MFIKILIGASILVAVLSVVIALQPATFHIERSVAIAAPPERAFSQVVDFHQWATWSPFDKLDPDMKKTYTGAPSGVGAIYAWAGNEARHQARVPQAFRRDQPGDVHVRADRNGHQRDLGNGREQQLHVEGDPHGDEHGQARGRGLRARARGHEDERRTNARTHGSLGDSELKGAGRLSRRQNDEVFDDLRADLERSAGPRHDGGHR
jgi:hypothetical protein